MKNLIKKLIKKLPILIVFFAVVGYAIYEYKKSHKEGDNGDKTPLLSGELKDVEKIRLSNASLSLSIVQEKGDWFLKKPLQDFVDFSELSRWFHALQDHKLKLISEEPNIQWEEYHLKNPSVVEITFSSSNVITFSVSEKTAFDGSWFIKKEGRLFLGESDLGREVNERTLDSYRSKKLLHSFGHPLTIRFQKKNHQPLNFIWKNSQWTYPEDKTLPLDYNHLNTFWTDLSSLKGNQITSPVTKDNLQKFNLSKPFVEISLGFEKTEDAIFIRFSPIKEGTVYGYASKRNYILKFSEADFEQILLSQDTIRDHGQPFRYKKEDAFQLQTKNGKFPFLTQVKPNSSTKKKSKRKKQEEQQWQITEPKNKMANSKKINAMLNAIYDLEGKKYKKESIGKVNRFLEIKNKSGEIVFKMEAGDSYNENGNKFFWVQTNLSQDKVGVLKESLDFIFEKNPFIKEKNTEKKKEDSSSSSTDKTENTKPSDTPKN